MREGTRLRIGVGALRGAGPMLIVSPHLDDGAMRAPGSLSLAVVTARVLVGPEEREEPTGAVMSASPFPPPADLPGTAVERELKVLEA